MIEAYRGWVEGINQSPATQRPSFSRHCARTTPGSSSESACMDRSGRRELPAIRRDLEWPGA